MTIWPGDLLEFMAGDDPAAFLADATELRQVLALEPPCGASTMQTEHDPPYRPPLADSGRGGNPVLGLRRARVATANIVEFCTNACPPEQA